MATKIYIDQGHNPQNPNAGAEGNGYREQDLVYTIGQELAAILQAEGYETKLSRPTPETQLGTSIATSLAARVNEANSWGADYFISLHANASELAGASGSEALVYRLNSVAADLGASILRGLADATGLPNRGVTQRTNLYVLRRTRMPAVLVELGFITNAGDAALMANSPQLFALGVANGITAYLS
ncbi:MAG: N-acetylmuramoyl-L-alanine amidase [Clostridia bacterium]|nr:N-acetylmuramoyl-L-alanine amidase [Clostridia bacterium]